MSAIYNNDTKWNERIYYDQSLTNETQGSGNWQVITVTNDGFDYSRETFPVADYNLKGICEKADRMVLNHPDISMAKIDKF
jgi:hypothetical protein